jgi:ATP phosphoribosyltransferase regulatory subunit
MDFPAGVSYYTGRTALRRRSVEERLMRLLARAGHEEVISPLLDYYTPSGDAEGELLVQKFPDLLTGRTMALRWDFTVQMAGLAAARLRRDGGSHRLCYRGNVFRTVREHSGLQRQMYQIGAELMGDASREETATVIALAVDLVRGAGIRDFRVVIGHVGYVEALRRKAHIPASAGDTLHGVLARKDVSALYRMVDAGTLAERAADRIRRALFLIGGPEILEEAASLAGPGGEAVAGELRGILDGMGPAAGRVLFDLTEPRGFDYYTGIMFHIVTPHLGREICKGGRYDNLLGHFGWPAPAVGFALDLDLIHQALDDPGGKGRRDG